MNNRKAYNAPLNSMDTISQTVGCRHSSPDNCARNSLEKICAFVRDDGICLSPPKSWINHYQRLKDRIAQAAEP